MTRAELKLERQALIEEIRAAFDYVSREGGVSWSEAAARDEFRGDAEKCAAARRRDTDRHWTELLERDRWEAEPDTGGFSFLDAIGFRYYLPAAMMMSIREHGDRGICHQLTVGVLGDRSRKEQLERLAILDERQARSVGRFLRYMAESARAAGGDGHVDAEYWTAAHESYWSSVK